MIDPVAIIKKRLENPRPLGPRFNAEKVGRSLGRQLEPDTMDRAWLSASKLGKCSRAISYDRQGIPKNGKVDDWRTKMVFAYGDAIETILLMALAEDMPEGWRLAGVGNEVGGQAEGALELAGIVIPCHPDGLIEAPDGEIIPLEVKSRTTFGFKEDQGNLKDHGVGFLADNSYWWQVQANQRAFGAKRSYVITCCKESGAFIGWEQPWSPTFDTLAVDHTLRALQDDAPRLLAGGAVKLEPNASGKLPWQCEYCAHWRTCWPTATVELVKGKTGFKNTLIVKG